MKALCTFSLLLLLFNPFAMANESEESRYIDFIKGQFAGEIGFVSAGVGMRFASWYELTMMYGVVPAFLDVDDIHTIALKNDFTFFRPRDDMRLYFDVTLLIALERSTGLPFITAR